MLIICLEYGLRMAIAKRVDYGGIKNKSSPISTMIEDSEPKGINL